LAYSIEQKLEQAVWHSWQRISWLSQNLRQTSTAVAEKGGVIQKQTKD
jgi:hypothetical protein